MACKEVTNKAASESTGSVETLKPGTTLLTCEPFVYASNPWISQTHQICDTCLVIKDSGLQRCTSCQSVWYCNRTCQKKGWKNGHKQECEGLPALMKEFKASSTTAKQLIWSIRIILRLLVKLQDGRDYFDELDIGGVKVKRRFSDLMSHSEELQNDKECRKEVFCMVYKLDQLFGSKIQIPSVAEFIEIYGKVKTNAFNIEDEFNILGSGMYVGSSILNHSCNPMAIRVFDGTTMHIRNVMEIPKDLPIDQVTVSYINSLMPSPIRRNELQSSYHFHCRCERCETGEFDSEMRSIICSNDGCNAKIDTEEMMNPCKGCGHVMGKEAIAKVVETEKYAAELLGSEWACLELTEAMIQKMKSANFSESHWMMVLLARKTYDQAVAVDSNGKYTDFEKAYKYGSIYVMGLRTYLSPYYQHFLQHLLRVCRLAIRLGKIDDAEIYIAEAESIGEVLFGKNSSFMGSQIEKMKKAIEVLKMERLANQFALTSVQA